MKRKTLAALVREHGGGARGRARAALAVGVDATTFWRWMTGRTKPQKEHVAALRALGVEAP